MILERSTAANSSGMAEEFGLGRGVTLDFIRLTAEQRQSFENDGFLIVPGALQPEAVNRLVEAGDRLAKSFLDKPELVGRPEYNHIDLRPGILREDALFDLVAHPTVSLIVQLLSPNIHLHSTTLIYKRPEDSNADPFRRGWHRDIRIPRDLGHRDLPLVGIKICYCLTEFQQPDSGMTLLARGTHRRPEPLAIPKGEVDPIGVEICDLKLSAGDALLFENRIFHTASPNRSNRVSKVLMYGYSYRWMKPEVYLDVPDQRYLDKASPIVHQLMGGYRDVDTPPWALQRWARRHKACSETVPWTVEI
jgi:hypothetical protein